MFIVKIQRLFLNIGLFTLIIMWVMACVIPSCKKKDSGRENDVPCYNPAKVKSAYIKAKNFLKNNEAAYMNGTLDNGKIGLYIDMMATGVRMEYYINTITLGKGVTVASPDGTKVTIDDELVRNYKEALCNETDNINKKL